MRYIFAFAFLSFIAAACTDVNTATNISQLTEIDSLPSPASDSAAEPNLYTDAKGQVYLSWIEKKSGHAVLKFSTLQKGQWAKARSISEGTNWFVNWADYPAIAAADSNNIAASYLEKSAAGKYTYDIKFTVSRDAGNRWSSPFILHDDGKAAEHGFVSINPYLDKFFVSWLDGRNSAGESQGGHDGHGGQMTLRGAVVDLNGKKENEWELDERVCDCCQTKTAITSTGPVVVYRNRTADEYRDISIVKMVGNKWTAPKIIHEDKWKIDACPVNGPAIDARGNNLAVAWFTMKEKKGLVKLAFSKDGGESFSAPVQIDEGNTIGRVDVVMINDSEAMISWIEGSSIKAAKVSMLSGKTQSFTIAHTSQQRSSGFPQMTLAGDQLIFAWTDDAAKTIRTVRKKL